MSKKKFKRGPKVLNVAELLEHDWFIVHFGPNVVKTLHKSFIGSWQLFMCERYVDSGQVYIAERLTNGEYCAGKTDEQLQEMLDTELCDYCEGKLSVIGSCDGAYCNEALEAWKEEYVK